MKRILQVVTVMNRGGLETMLMNYYRQLDRNEMQFDFMVHRMEEGHYDREIEAMGGRIYRMPAIKPGNYRMYFKALNEFFNEHPSYSVVHAHINENSGFVLRAAKKAGVRSVIAHSHLSDLGFDYKWPFRLYGRYAMRSVPTSYFACSEKAGDWLFGKQVAKENGITVLNNAVDAKAFAFNEAGRKAMRQSLGLTDDQLVIGHIGRFNKQKNHPFLLEVFAEVAKKRADAVLILVGEGSMEMTIRQQAASLGLSDRILFLGVRKEIASLFHAFDLFLFPSLFEGLPVVLVEAQAAGVTSIVSSAITEEANITGELISLPLSDGAEKWAEHVLAAPVLHQETLPVMQEKGYDTSTMAKWLTDYYLQNG